MRAGWIQGRGLKALVLLLLVFYEGHAKETCRTGVKTDKNLRGVNLDKTSGLPFYWFDLHRASDGYLPEHTYTFRLHSSSEASTFSDAVLQVETTSNCGTGDLIVNTTYLYQPRYCPNMIMTEYKKPMTNVPFKWRAPQCGCIKFRATVIRNGATYFYDDEKISDGNLVKTVCPHGVRVAEQLLVEDETTTDSSTKTTSPITTKMDRAARLDLLCKITSTLNNVELLKRPEFIERRKLQNSSLVQLLNIELALEQRRADVSSCCHKKGEDKTKCFDNIRRYRIDQLCGDGQPRIPFVEQKNNYMRKRESECCWQIGEPRYNCFNKSNEGISPYSIDYSLDDSDPVNDIADYPKEVEHFEKASNAKFFGSPPLEKPQHNEGIPNIETLTKLVETTTQTPEGKSERLSLIRESFPRPPRQPSSIPHMQPTSRSHRQPSSKPYRETTPSLVPTRRRQRPTPAAEIKLQQGRTHGQGDMGYNLRKQAKSTRKNLSQGHSASSVEITVNALKQRLWKSSLKLECCQEGQIFASKSGHTDVWDRCRSAAKDYRSTVVRGKKICSNTFQKCCVEQFLTASARTRTISETLTPTPEVPQWSFTTKQPVTASAIRTGVKKGNHDVDSSLDTDADMMEQDENENVEDYKDREDEVDDTIGDDSYDSNQNENHEQNDDNQDLDLDFDNDDYAQNENDKQNNDDQDLDLDDNDDYAQNENDDQDGAVDDDNDDDNADNKISETNNGEEKKRKRKFLHYPKEDPTADTIHKTHLEKRPTLNSDILQRVSKQKRNRRRHSRKLRRRKHKRD